MQLYLNSIILVFDVVLVALGDFVGFAFALGLKLRVKINCKQYYKKDKKESDNSGAEGKIFLERSFPLKLKNFFLRMLKFWF
jgi:hypothetical protein